MLTTRHGMRSTYVNQKCRCEQCRAANRAYTRKLIAKDPERVQSYRRHHYLNNLDQYRAARERWKKNPRNKESQKIKYENFIALLNMIKSTAGCARCGESNPILLDFHHKDPTQKRIKVSKMTGYSRREQFAEILKCDVFCKNHHILWHRNNHGLDN